MDQELRNKLRRAVNELRTVLEESVYEQLESTYGILRDGRLVPVEDVPPLRANDELRRRRQEIEQAIRHEEALLEGQDRTARAVEKFVRESAFTTLNRLAALKLMERRKLVPTCISHGPESDGFRLFREIAPGLAHSQADGGYRLFIELLFDDIAHGVRVLFDRTLPTSYLFPDGQTLRKVLGILNDEKLSPVWDEDEALGWVYQYFTPKELRDKARKESDAPRNSYELAFRNQFYTPEYVVRFLAENTLGRLWWEIYPETSLVEREFLLYRPGERPPEREPCDPRRLRILDPACGSGHFLHYCFDLLEVIYREAYELGAETGHRAHAAGAQLRADYPDEKEFKRAIPKLILEHNLWGIDIDLRATQLTALSLYLRAKRAHPEAEITRVNAILAAPIPGDSAQLEAFLATLDGVQDGPALKLLLRRITEELGLLAGEAGSLLKPEGAIRRHVEDLKENVREARAGRQLALDGFLPPAFEQAELPLERMPTEAFWHQAEGKLLELLRDYAQRAETNGVARRLFADDVAHGIAFVDALMQQYDVILMNPPFGAASRPSKAYVDKTYPITKHDLYAAFVERGLGLLRAGGFLGAITSRTGFFLSSFQKWRKEILLEKTDIIAFADLGYGVLDTAMVETAAYVLRKREAK